MVRFVMKSSLEALVDGVVSLLSSRKVENCTEQNMRYKLYRQCFSFRRFDVRALRLHENSQTNRMI